MRLVSHFILKYSPSNKRKFTLRITLKGNLKYLRFVRCYEFKVLVCNDINKDEIKMKCPKCGYENKEGALYCNLCTEVFTREKIQKPVKEKIQDCSGEFMPVRRRIKYGYLIRIFVLLFLILNILLRGSVFKNLPGQLSFIFIAIFMIFILVDIYYYFTLSCPNCNYELGKFCCIGVRGFGIDPFKFFKLRFCPECSCLLVKK